MIDRLPKSMTIIGGGVIGCEYATDVRGDARQGHRSSTGATELLPFLDLEMGERLRGAMSALGIDVRLERAGRAA